MATPELFNSEVGYPEDSQRTSVAYPEFAVAQPTAVPANLPIATFAYRVVKPAFDLALIFFALPILLPLGLLIALVICATSRGSALYRHRRLGQFQNPIYVWKFRTMYKDSDRLLEHYLSTDAEARREWSETHKLKSDPRITPIGRFLRSTSLDEIPQLLNVLAGEMSIVGPRPIVDKEKSKYGIYLQMFSYAVPGITGLWQTSGRCDLSYNQRVQLDMRYVTRWSLWMELKIVLKTIFVMIHREGAY
ncbi:sugar transferase [Silvibacterium sp.]|uniref:sugar transferase n=1 Tax=Silvibacterium sp. TaxID=1964179 RepID=UPI0039E30EC6